MVILKIRITSHPEMSRVLHHKNILGKKYS